jgi:hypothetical protein
MRTDGRSNAERKPLSLKQRAVLDLQHVVYSDREERVGRSGVESHQHVSDPQGDATVVRV